MAELIDKDKVKELPVYEFGVSLLSAEKYVKLSDLEKLLTTTEAEIRAEVIQKLIDRCRKQKEQFPNDEDAYQFGALNGINICIAEMAAEQLKGE